MTPPRCTSRQYYDAAAQLRYWSALALTSGEGRRAAKLILEAEALEREGNKTRELERKA